MKSTAFLALACSLLLFYQCTDSDTANPPLVTIDSPATVAALDLVEKQESFSFAAEKDTLFTTEEGISIYVPNDAFVDADGQVVTGKVELQVEDYVDLSEIVSANLSTVSKEGLLETRGMLNIRALANGEEVQLQSGKGVDLFFPGVQEDYAGAQLFYGVESEDGTIEWEVAEEQMADNERVEWGKKNKLSFFHSRWREGGDQVARSGFFGKDLSVITDSLNNWLQLTEEEIQEIEGADVTVYYTLFEDGDLETFQIDGAISRKLKRKIKQNLDGMPRVSPFKRYGDPAPVTGIIWFNVTSVANEILNNFSLRSYDLGWINCDIFWRIEAPMIDMQVEAPATDVLMRLVFNEYKTIVVGQLDENGKVRFAQVPEGAAVKVIAITPSGQKAKLSVTETTVQKEVAALVDFEEIGKEELAARLDGLLK